jgi:hypothetical protein
MTAQPWTFDTALPAQLTRTYWHRCRGLEWLSQNAWRDRRRIRIDVLVGNQAGIGFWRSVGFRDYCLTMERAL